jgi:hypothetical protein
VSAWLVSWVDVETMAIGLALIALLHAAASARLRRDTVVHP